MLAILAFVCEHSLAYFQAGSGEYPSEIVFAVLDGALCPQMRSAREEPMQNPLRTVKDTPL